MPTFSEDGHISLQFSQIQFVNIVGCITTVKTLFSDLDNSIFSSDPFQFLQPESRRKLESLEDLKFSQTLKI